MASRTIVLAHGAGAGMDSPFMNSIASGLVERGERVARFEFPYMNERRIDGGRKPPNTSATLMDCWREAIKLLGPADRLVIGGKSLGGRIASLVADETNVAGLICLGYPFHPPGRPERIRTQHLMDLATPTLIVQGERDPFGNQGEVDGYDLSNSIRIVWLSDGDHSFKPRKKSGHTEPENLDKAIHSISTFVERLF